jgi:hypothetical protein
LGFAALKGLFDHVDGGNHEALEPQGPCEPEEQKIEDRFLTLLKEAVRWRAEGPTLILESGSGSIHLAKR